MSWERLLYEKRDAIIKITMNRPEVHNAQDFLMLEELMEAFRQADLDDEARVIVLAGAGPSFSSGHDLSGKGRQAKHTLEMLVEKPGLEGRLKGEPYFYYRLALTVRDVGKPTIAMVQGHCITGGLLLACMCDLIVAAENASFANPVARMTTAGAALPIEIWNMGIRKAKEFLWTGDPMDAREALHLGMVNRVVPLERLEGETMGLAKKIALMPPVTVSLIKKSLNRILDIMGLANSFDYHFLINQMSHSTEEAARMRKEIDEARARGGMRELLRTRDRTFKNRRTSPPLRKGVR